MTFNWQPDVIYNRYYNNGSYNKRYPTHNPRSLEFIHNYARNAKVILDFGCGEGRYTIPLLQRTSAQIIAHDISQSALAILQEKLKSLSWNQRVTLVEDPFENLESKPTPDLIIMMFGVLSQIVGKENRINLLRRIRNLILENKECTLILSVPNAYRRFWLNQIESAIRGKFNISSTQQLELGDIKFKRFFDNKEHQFFYHLYTVSSLEQEMREAGFSIENITLESVFPESWITQNSLCYRLDQFISQWLPEWLGYGMIAVGKVIG